MGCLKLAYNLYSNPAMRCAYSAGDGQEGYACEQKSLRQLKKMGNITYKTDAVDYQYENNNFPMGGNPYSGIDWGNPKMDGGGATKPPVTTPSVAIRDMSPEQITTEINRLQNSIKTLKIETFKLELQLNEQRRFNEKAYVILPRIFLRSVLFLYPHMNINDSADSFFPDSMLDDIDRRYDSKEREIYKKYEKFF